MRDCRRLACRRKQTYVRESSGSVLWTLLNNVYEVSGRCAIELSYSVEWAILNNIHQRYIIELSYDTDQTRLDNIQKEEGGGYVKELSYNTNGPFIAIFTKGI